MNTFEAQPLSDEEGNAINLEDEASNFSIKYLTSSNLMGLEVRSKISKFFWYNNLLQTVYLDIEYSFVLDLSQLKDPSFRRHILVQCLILFDYLKVLLSSPF